MKASEYLREAKAKLASPDNVVLNPLSSREVDKEDGYYRFCLIGALDEAVITNFWRTSGIYDRDIEAYKILENSAKKHKFDVLANAKPENFDWMHRIYDAAIADAVAQEEK